MIDRARMVGALAAFGALRAALSDLGPEEGAKVKRNGKDRLRVKAARRQRQKQRRVRNG
ncbi:hypothetical protein KUW09_04775 [Mameliella alba]|nr:hypothetical protein [Antarctobacter heliothermus]MBY6143342.1 hypothetical protein [Mameliella alba]MBY6163985.1 hypothetical protein [Mameliella alba]MBY6172457.1 hypothetical protein [Mameliella alba]MBY6177471.1 hypothetical protein [Mameliella alba]